MNKTQIKNVKKIIMVFRDLAKFTEVLEKANKTENSKILKDLKRYKNMKVSEEHSKRTYNLNNHGKPTSI